MQLVFRSWLLVSLMELLITGDVNASKMLGKESQMLDRNGNGKINLRRRRLQPTRERNNEEDLFPVIIGVKDNSDGVLENVLSRLSTIVRPKFNRVSAMSALVSREELYELEQDPNVLYVENDPLVYPDNGEVTPYGLRMVQAFAPIISKNNFTGRAACNNPNSFKIGIVDSGLAIDHPDIPCLPHDQEDTNCIGKEFGIDAGDGLWYNPIRKFHGTHVAGTIGASGKNKLGVQGIINDGNICFIIGRVFGESGGGTRMSNIFEAIEWVADQGAKVINLSLGVDMYHSSGDALMKAIYDEGTLVIAASGNGGTNASHYPANYANVLSVAAIDSKREHASFSQYNSGVDISAPGVDILSTQPLNLSGSMFLSTANVSATGLYFDNSVQLLGSINGTLIYCPLYGSEVCPGNGGHICLIERGNVTFETQILNCQRSRGIAAIVYNNEPGNINEKLSNSTETLTIPALQISAFSGGMLASEAVGKTLIIEEKMGYGYLSGTSMAVPHVTGVIAKVWRMQLFAVSCQSVRHAPIKKSRNVFLNTTIDLGDPGKDDLYGQGLVQAIPAYRCLKNTTQCC